MEAKDAKEAADASPPTRGDGEAPPSSGADAARKSPGSVESTHAAAASSKGSAVKAELDALECAMLKGFSDDSQAAARAVLEAWNEDNEALDLRDDVMSAFAAYLTLEAPAAGFGESDDAVCRLLFEWAKGPAFMLTVNLIPSLLWCYASALQEGRCLNGVQAVFVALQHRWVREHGDGPFASEALLYRHPNVAFPSVLHNGATSSGTGPGSSHSAELMGQDVRIISVLEGELRHAAPSCIDPAGGVGASERAECMLAALLLYNSRSTALSVDSVAHVVAVCSRFAACGTPFALSAGEDGSRRPFYFPVAVWRELIQCLCFVVCYRQSFRKQATRVIRLIQKRAQVELDSELLLASNAAMQLCISEKQKSEEERAVEESGGTSTKENGEQWGEGA